MSINRNIVECKVILSITVARTLSVLIETLWNVKWFQIRLTVLLL